jgi:peptide deformylase
MAERAIRIFGDPVLTSPTERIGTIDDGVRALVRDLLDTVALPGRAGVAATQIGFGLRAFSYNVDGTIGYILNPELVAVTGEHREVDEGCLSLPGLWYPTRRFEGATVRGTDLEGNTVEVSGTGLLAQALQHECDHLEGMLYIDRLEGDARRDAMRSIRASDWF